MGCSMGVRSSLDLLCLRRYHSACTIRLLHPLGADMTSLIHQVAKLDIDGSSPEEIAMELDIHLQMVAWLQLNDGYKLVREAVCAAQA